MCHEFVKHQKQYTDYHKAVAKQLFETVQLPDYKVKEWYSKQYNPSLPTGKKIGHISPCIFPSTDRGIKYFKTLFCELQEEERKKKVKIPGNANKCETLIPLRMFWDISHQNIILTKYTY